MLYQSLVFLFYSSFQHRHEFVSYFHLPANALDGLERSMESGGFDLFFALEIAHCKLLWSKINGVLFFVKLRASLLNLLRETNEITQSLFQSIPKKKYFFLLLDFINV